jgi:hypothetical protein
VGQGSTVSGHVCDHLHISVHTYTQVMSTDTPPPCAFRQKRFVEDKTA